MGDWESDREYTTYGSAPQRLRKVEDSAWPAAVSYIATLTFIAFILWLFLG